jgi:hypothetical protein
MRGSLTIFYDYRIKMEVVLAEAQIELLPGALPFTNPLLIAIKGPI